MKRLVWLIFLLSGLVNAAEEKEGHQQVVLHKLVKAIKREEWDRYVNKIIQGKPNIDFLVKQLVDEDIVARFKKNNCACDLIKQEEENKALRKSTEKLAKEACTEILAFDHSSGNLIKGTEAVLTNKIAWEEFRLLRKMQQTQSNWSCCIQ